MEREPRSNVESVWALFDYLAAPQPSSHSMASENTGGLMIPMEHMGNHEQDTRISAAGSSTMPRMLLGLETIIQ